MTDIDSPVNKRWNAGWVWVHVPFGGCWCGHSQRSAACCMRRVTSHRLEAILCSHNFIFVAGSSKNDVIQTFFYIYIKIRFYLNLFKDSLLLIYWKTLKTKNNNLNKEWKRCKIVLDLNVRLKRHLLSPVTGISCLLYTFLQKNGYVPFVHITWTILVFLSGGKGAGIGVIPGSSGCQTRDHCLRPEQIIVETVWTFYSHLCGTKSEHDKLGAFPADFAVTKSRISTQNMIFPKINNIFSVPQPNQITLPKFISLNGSHLPMFHHFQQSLLLLIVCYNETR